MRARFLRTPPGDAGAVSHCPQPPAGAGVGAGTWGPTWPTIAPWGTHPGRPPGPAQGPASDLAPGTGAGSCRPEQTPAPSPPVPGEPPISSITGGPCSGSLRRLQTHFPGGTSPAHPCRRVWGPAFALHGGQARPPSSEKVARAPRDTDRSATVSRPRLPCSPVTQGVDGAALGCSSVPRVSVRECALVLSAAPGRPLQGSVVELARSRWEKDGARDGCCGGVRPAGGGRRGCWKSDRAQASGSAVSDSRRRDCRAARSRVHRPPYLRGLLRAQMDGVLWKGSDAGRLLLLGQWDRPFGQHSQQCVGSP